MIDGAQSVWAQYTIQVDNRAKLQADLKDQGIPTAVYYPIPLSQAARLRAISPPRRRPTARRCAERVVSLPMHPYLDETTQDRIIEAVLKSVGADARRRIRFRLCRRILIALRARERRAMPRGCSSCAKTDRASTGPCAICRTLLRAGDTLVVNDTRVIPARLTGTRLAREEGEGARIEITLHKRVSAFRLSRLRTARETVEAGRPRPPRRNAQRRHRRARCGRDRDRVRQDRARTSMPRSRPKATCRCRPISRAGARRMRAIAPTIRRSMRKTPVRSRRPRRASTSRPTCSRASQQAGITRESVTLHVGAGTFLPVTADDTSGHRMHSEWATLSDATARSA